MAAKKEGVTYEEIVWAVRAGNYAPVYYLMGEESYYIDKVSEYIVDSALKEEERDFNLTVCYGADVTADEVINAAKRFPMMAERQVVLVREAQNLQGKERLSYYLEHPQPTTVLVLCHKHGVLDRRKKLAADIQKKGVFQLPGELRGIRSQLREEKLMAVDGSRKVPHILADFLRQTFIFHEKTFQGPFLKFRMRLQKPVQAVHIRLQVPGVVEEQSLRIDMRLQGVIEIREGQKLKGIILDHGITSPHHNA